MPQLDHAQLEPVRAALLDLADEDAAAFAGGSQLVGLGNSRSNLNVYVVGGQAGVGDGVPDQELSTSYLDVEHVALDRLGRDVDKVLSGAPSPGDMSALVSVKSGRELVIRFFYGAIVRDPHGRLAELAARLRDGETALRQQLICWHAVQCVNYRDDYVGAVEAGDLDTAEVNANRILNGALQAYLAGCGDYYVGDKWTWAKLARSGSSPALIEAARLAVMTRLTGRSRREPRHKVELAQVLLAAAVARGWDEPGAASWTVVPTLEEVHLADTWFPVPFADQVLMDGIDLSQVRVSPQGVELWALAVLGGRDAAVSAFSASSGVPREEVERYYDSFAGRGMVTDR